MVIQSSHKENQSSVGSLLKVNPKIVKVKRVTNLFLVNIRKLNRKRNANTVRRRVTQYKSVFSLKERNKKKKRTIKENNQKPL